MQQQLLLPSQPLAHDTILRMLIRYLDRGSVRHLALELNPPAVCARAQVRMGFPQRNAEGFAGAAFVGEDCKLGSGGFTCPRCRARVVELPSRCSTHRHFVRCAECLSFWASLLAWL